MDRRGGSETRRKIINFTDLSLSRAINTPSISQHERRERTQYIIERDSGGRSRYISNVSSNKRKGSNNNIAAIYWLELLTQSRWQTAVKHESCRRVWSRDSRRQLVGLYYIFLDPFLLTKMRGRGRERMAMSLSIYREWRYLTGRTRRCFW